MTGDNRPLPRKKDVTLLLLEGPSVYVHLDPRREGVVVPKWLTGQPQLVLQVGLNMPVPIPDLHVDDDGVSCTLSFNRAPFWCKIPWSAVYAVVGADQRGMVWPDDVPSEVAAQLLNKPPPGPPKPTGPQKVEDKKAAQRPTLGLAQKPGQQPVRKRPTLEALDGGASPARPGPTTAKPPEPSPKPEPAPSPAAEPRPEPQLATVRSAPSAVPASDAPDQAEPATTEGARTGGSEPARTPARGGKSKRELPPYLRVIK